MAYPTGERERSGVESVRTKEMDVVALDTQRFSSAITDENAPGFAWKIAKPSSVGTVTMVAWQTGPTKTGAGSHAAKVVPPSVDLDIPRQLQSTLPP